MRRVLVIVGVTALAATAVVLMGAGGGSSYQVRAIFDSAAFVVKGEDVKIAGVRVGQIDSLHLTPDNKAAVVLDITDPGYQDFRRDATCRIRPQSLIGEQFVECTPTEPRAATDQPAPKLQKITKGDGEGQYLLPESQTSTSVALDLVGNIYRLPVRQRLTLILNELGVGLAGRGEDLNRVIRSSAPALQQLDKVLNLLAAQNKTLARLAVDSDADLAPLARERKAITGFITSSQEVAAATAARGAALTRTLQTFPAFLAELRPTMRQLGDLADQTTPVLSSLHGAATDINEMIRQLGPFSAASTPALIGLGQVGVPGIPALKASLPIVKDVRSFAHTLRPVSATLADVLDSFRRNNGIQYLMDYVYYQALAVNGFDSVSHFLRAGLIVNTCSTYALTPQDECLAKFSNPQASAARALTGASLDEVLQRTAAVLRGADPKDVLAADGAAPVTGTPAATRTGARTVSTRGDATAPATTAPVATPTPAPAASTTPAPAGTAAPAATPDPSTTTDMLDYLFGKDGA